MWHELDLSMAWMNLGVIRAIDNRVNRDRYDWIGGFFFCDESWVVIANRKLQRLFWRFVAAWGNLRVWVERWLNLSEECQGLRSRQAGDFLKHDKKVYRYTDIQDTYNIQICTRYTVTFQSLVLQISWHIWSVKSEAWNDHASWCLNLKFGDTPSDTKM